MTSESALSIEDRLAAALNEVADCVSIDAEAAAWTDEEPPRARRTKTFLVVGIAALLAIVVAIAVSARSGHDNTSSTPVSDTVTTTTGVAFIDDGPLTTPRIYSNGTITLLPPAPGVQPHVTARMAFKAPRVCPKTGQVLTQHFVLADATIFDYGTVHNDGTIAPNINHRLVWVSTLTDVPLECSFHSGGPGPRSGITTATPPSTTPSGATELDFFDATTGAFLDMQGFGGSFTTATVTDAVLAGSWQPYAIAGYDAPLRNSSSRPTIIFDGHGKWNGSNTCNRINGSYRLRKWDAFEVVVLSATPADCAGHQPFEDVLAKAAHIELDGGSLRVSARDGRELAILVRRPGPDRNLTSRGAGI